MGLNYFDQPFAWDVQTNIQKHLKIRNFMSTDAWSNLDKVDQKILEILNENARTPSKEIATELRKSGHDVSDRTIRKRIERPTRRVGQNSSIP